jgi:DNA-binding IclR family transcriptional regulator
LNVTNKDINKKGVLRVDKEKKDDNSVQSIDRILDIIEALSTESQGLRITDLSETVGLHKSTVHRLVNTLQRRGYINKTENGNYKIGLKLIEAVSCYINSLELQTEARPYLAKITSNLGLTSHLGVLDREEVVYIEKMDVFSSLKMYSQIGLRMHAYCSSLGKCLLSSYSKEELEVVMKNCSFIKFTSATISSMDELHHELTLVRSRGWAIDNEEYETGHRCIGAPIYDYRGDIIAAISASESTRVLTESRIQEVGEFVKQIALEISKNMGYME